MFYFVTYLDQDDHEQCLRFLSETKLWEWLQDHGNAKNLAVYKGDCVLDWS